MGQWRVQADGVLTQLSEGSTVYRFPVAIYQPTVAADIDVSIRFRTISGKVDRAAGIALRVLDPDSYYVLRANTLENNVNFYKVIRRSRREIKGASAEVRSSFWHSVGLKVEGDRFTASFDGATLFSVTDRTFSAAGRTTLWTKADSVTWFDSIEIKLLH
jgi:hypothetical protein